MLKIVEKLVGRRPQSDGDGETFALASILSNMVFVGIMKRATCVYNEDGVCKRIRLSVRPPSIATVEKDGVFYIVVERHPEICAVCPHWRSVEEDEQSC